MPQIELPNHELLIIVASETPSEAEDKLQVAARKVSGALQCPVLIKLHVFDLCYVPFLTLRSLVRSRHCLCSRTALQRLTNSRDRNFVEFGRFDVKWYRKDVICGASPFGQLRYARHRVVVPLRPHQSTDWTLMAELIQGSLKLGLIAFDSHLRVLTTVKLKRSDHCLRLS
jgi:hypothetical protein